MNKKQEEKKVTITISASEYDALAKIAKAMNKVGWCGSDNTVASVVEGFALTPDADNVIENIVNGIDTRTDDEIKSAMRLDELNTALAIAVA